MAHWLLGGWVEVVGCKSMMKSSAMIFYLVIKTTFKKYFYNINWILQNCVNIYMEKIYKWIYYFL